MAITKNPVGAENPAPHTVTRAFYWAGTVAAVGTVLQLSKADAAALLAANKVTPGEAVADGQKPPKKTKATEETTP